MRTNAERIETTAVDLFFGDRHYIIVLQGEVAITVLDPQDRVTTEYTLADYVLEDDQAGNTGHDQEFPSTETGGESLG